MTGVWVFSATPCTQGLSLIHGEQTDHDKIDLLNKRHIYVRVCVYIYMRVFQEVREDLIESGQCRQVATELVELHVNNESLRQCVDDLKHTVNVRRIPRC